MNRSDRILQHLTDGVALTSGQLAERLNIHPAIARQWVHTATRSGRVEIAPVSSYPPKYRATGVVPAQKPPVPNEGIAQRAIAARPLLASVWVLPAPSESANQPQIARRPATTWANAA